MNLPKKLAAWTLSMMPLVAACGSHGASDDSTRTTTNALAPMCDDPSQQKLFMAANWNGAPPGGIAIELGTDTGGSLFAIVTPGYPQIVAVDYVATADVARFESLSSIGSSPLGTGIPCQAGGGGTNGSCITIMDSVQQYHAICLSDANITDIQRTAGGICNPRCTGGRSCIENQCVSTTCPIGYTWCGVDDGCQKGRYCR
jgi:hypothetical protein